MVDRALWAMRFAFTLPLVGRLVHYRGWLKIGATSARLVADGTGALDEL
jgi:hypothetical protein